MAAPYHLKSVLMADIVSQISALRRMGLKRFGGKFLQRHYEAPPTRQCVSSSNSSGSRSRSSSFSRQSRSEIGAVVILYHDSKRKGELVEFRRSEHSLFSVEEPSNNFITRSASGVNGRKEQPVPSAPQLVYEYDEVSGEKEVLEAAHWSHALLNLGGIMKEVNMNDKQGRLNRSLGLTTLRGTEEDLELSTIPHAKQSCLGKLRCDPQVNNDRVYRVVLFTTEYHREIRLTQHLKPTVVLMERTGRVHANNLKACSPPNRKNVSASHSDSAGSRRSSTHTSRRSTRGDEEHDHPVQQELRKEPQKEQQQPENTVIPYTESSEDEQSPKRKREKRKKRTKHRKNKRSKRVRSLGTPIGLDSADLDVPANGPIAVEPESASADVVTPVKKSMDDEEIHEILEVEQLSLNNIFLPDEAPVPRMEEKLDASGPLPPSPPATNPDESDHTEMAAEVPVTQVENQSSAEQTDTATQTTFEPGLSKSTSTDFGMRGSVPTKVKVVDNEAKILSTASHDAMCMHNRTQLLQHVGAQRGIRCLNIERVSVASEKQPFWLSDRLVLFLRAPNRPLRGYKVLKIKKNTDSSIVNENHCVLTIDNTCAQRYQRCCYGTINTVVEKLNEPPLWSSVLKFEGRRINEGSSALSGTDEILSQLSTLTDARIDEIFQQKRLIEAAYRLDCEGYTASVGKLVRLNPDLRDRLLASLRTLLEDRARQSINELQEFILKTRN
ncbi:hypothetical protein CLF_103764 [Clonorchis sinensis]|uniref:Periphilin-1 C-terminal domain-containing protein n=1 Tax=Clonorchis sinensis TaxID=79923 RepID=G7YAC1_CLOSI|nr:hypothetical protein CLF_103764 [Clonorchis sinensis]